MASDNVDLIYLHGGCPEEGRLADLWSFSISSREWIRLSHAPGPPRGGSSLCFCSYTKKLYRFGAFDGVTEVGGTIDIYDPETDSWSEQDFEADGENGPLPRSVAGLIELSVDGRPFIVSLFGEGSPSSLGHAGAGKFFGGAWAWDIYEKKWYKVAVDKEAPSPRGWFSAASLGEGKVIIHGGLGENNERLDDVWTGTLTEQ